VPLLIGFLQEGGRALNLLNPEACIAEWPYTELSHMGCIVQSAVECKILRKSNYFKADSSNECKPFIFAGTMNYREN